jgi:heme/copper-type cytochrome/quinol oxidase subunit 1
MKVVPAASAVAVPDDKLKNMGWPKSPVKLFGIGAAVFLAGGLLSLSLHVPSFKIPVLWSGKVHFVSFFYLWLAAAAPFAIFAALYKYLIDVHRLPFAESMNRIHFVVTIIAVLDLVRVFVSWEEAMISTLAALLFGPQFVTLAVLALFDFVVFAVSAIDSYRRSVARA